MYVRYVRAYNVTMSITHTHTHAHRERRVLALSTGLPSLLLLSQSATVLYQHFTRYALFRIESVDKERFLSHGGLGHHTSPIHQPTFLFPFFQKAPPKIVFFLLKMSRLIFSRKKFLEKFSGNLWPLFI